MPRSADLSFRAALAVAHQLADASGPVTLRYFRKSPAVSNKQQGHGFDPVTDGDKAAERTMTNLLARSFPDHGVVGEEYGRTADDARYTWVLDPIDGTRAFIMGQPMWGTLIGLLDSATPLLGMMNQPFTGERFWSTQDAAHLRIGDTRTKRITTRTGMGLNAAILAATHPDLFTKRRDKSAFERLANDVQMTRFGGDCYNYCLLAAGHIDLVAEVDLKPHDIVALIPIVERAGGVITTWDGKPAINGGRIVAAGSKKLHQAAIKLLNPT